MRKDFLLQDLLLLQGSGQVEHEHIAAFYQRRFLFGAHLMNVKSFIGSLVAPVSKFSVCVFSSHMFHPVRRLLVVRWRPDERRKSRGAVRVNPKP